MAAATTPLRTPFSSAEPDARARREIEAWHDVVARMAAGARPDLVLRAAARAAARVAGDDASAAVYLLGERAGVVRRGDPALERAAARRLPAGARLALAAHAGALPRELLHEFDGPPVAADLAAIKSGRPRVIGVLHRAREGTRCARLLERGYRAVAVLPIVAGDRAAGILRVAVRDRGALDAGAVLALAGFARLAGLALERRRLAERSREGRPRTSFGRELRAWLAGTIDLDRLLARIAVTIAAAVDVPQCFVLLHDPEQRLLAGVAATPPLDRRLDQVRIPCAARRSLAAGVFRRKRSQAIADARRDKRVNPRLVKLFDETSLLGIPLVAGGEAIGVIMLGETRRVRRFTDAEVAAAEELSAIAALAIENARRYRDAEVARERAEVLLATVRECGASVDLRETMSRIARRTLEITTATRCSIYLPDETLQVVTEIVHHGWRGPERRVLEALRGRRIDDFKAGRELRSGRRPLVYDDIGAGGIPRELARQLGLRGVVAVPVRAHGELLAVFAVGYPPEVPRVPRAEVAVLEGVANQVALCLANARAFAEIARQRQELDVLTSRMIGAQEEERRRIARELHDGISQTLTAVKFELERHLRRPDACEEIRRAVATIGDAIGEVRRLCMDLRPSQLDHLGLLATVQWYAKGFRKRTGIAVDVEGPEALPPLAPDLEINVYRIIQEALGNVAKHAGATRAAVRLRERARRLEISVQDDGKGFDPGAVKRAAAGESGMGLLTMSERAHLLGGELTIRARPGRGTTVEASVPLRGRTPRPASGAGWATASDPDGGQ